MKFSVPRRALLLGAFSAPFVGACAPLSHGTGSAPATSAALAALQALGKLEASTGGRLGIAAFRVGSGDGGVGVGERGSAVLHRADERFPMCSTFKVLAASALLRRSAVETGLLQRRVHYAASDLVTYSPITEKHVPDGMTIAELCAAALQYSDNSAGNMLIDALGGSPAVTAFARSIGDTTFRLDRRETELNTALPGDPRDTCTPRAMARNLQALLVGDALPARQREQLVAWMRGNTTGATRIRASVPADWRVADKTGAGDYGTVNDIGVLWPPSGAPIAMAIYFTQTVKEAPMRNDVVAAAARIAATALA
ncbi:MAG: Beta-lactamase [Variovorax sp.]|nr:Beta-lactamase [Variovorax sp.]